MAASSGNKTEKPTPQRLKKAREQGQFLVARGLVGAIQFAAIVVLLSKLISQWATQIQHSMAVLVERSMTREIGDAEWPFLLRSLFQNLFLPIAATGGILLLITAGTHLGITKMGFSLQRLTPKADRFNPFSRLRELPQQNLKSLLEAVLLLGVLGLTIYSLFNSYATRFLRMPFEAVPVAAAEIGSSLEDMLWKAAAIFAAFGAFDLFRQYRQYTSRLKMSKEEVKEEHKRNEGDPQLKARIRRLRRDLLRRQMMRDVPKATAVIVNPTHFAVAIRYELETMACPVLVAKGRNWLALRIRTVAQEHEIPIIENPPLARALYDSIDVGGAIPPEFYKAVAEILAYIYRLMGRKLPD
jgi:flagellar biosynthesis protein FlhB